MGWGCEEDEPGLSRELIKLMPRVLQGGERGRQDIFMIVKNNEWRFIRGRGQEQTKRIGGWKRRVRVNETNT